MLSGQGRYLMLIVYDKTARRLGEETRREARQRCSFRRGGHGRVGFGEFDLLGFKVHSGVAAGYSDRAG